MVPEFITENWPVGTAMAASFGALWMCVRHENHCRENSKAVWEKLNKTSDDVSDIASDVSYIRGRFDGRDDKGD